MSSDDRTYDTIVSAEIAIDGADGDKFTWTPATPVQLVRMGFTATTTYDGTTTELAVAIDINSSDGDGTFTRGDGDAGTFDLANATDFDAGKAVYIDAASRIRLRPGDQLIFQQTEGADAGDGVFWVEYQKLAFQSGSSAAADDLLVNAEDLS